MSPSQRLFIAGIVFITGVVGFAAGRAIFRPTETVLQPIAFNHQKHVEELGLECDSCHEFYATAEHSGLPTLSLCLDCHEEPQTDTAEEQKIRDLAADGRLDVFRKLFTMPDHAFYSHRRHVTVAGITCETCHGPVAQTQTPPLQALVRVDMDFCVECHERLEVPSDCTSCHR